MTGIWQSSSGHCMILKSSWSPLKRHYSGENIIIQGRTPLTSCHLLFPRNGIRNAKWSPTLVCRSFSLLPEVNDKPAEQLTPPSHTQTLDTPQNMINPYTIKPNPKASHSNHLQPPGGLLHVLTESKESVGLGPDVFGFRLALPGFR